MVGYSTIRIVGYARYCHCKKNVAESWYRSIMFLNAIIFTIFNKILILKLRSYKQIYAPFFSFYPLRTTYNDALYVNFSFISVRPKKYFSKHLLIGFWFLLHMKSITESDIILITTVCLNPLKTVLIRDHSTLLLMKKKKKT